MRVTWPTSLRRNGISRTRRRASTAATHCAAVGAWWCVALLAAAAPAAPSDNGTDGVLHRFLEHVAEQPMLDDTARELVRRTAEQRAADDPASFLTEALAVLWPEFNRGLEAYDDEEFKRCAAIMETLTSDGDPFLSTNAAVFEIKALVEGDELEEALARLEVLRHDEDRVATYSFFAAEMHYTYGYCLLRDLRYDDAIRVLRAFQLQYPQAPARLALSADQILAELLRRKPEQMSDVADLMAFAGRRIGLGDVGDTVRQRQDHAVEILEHMIKKAEDQEKNSKKSKSKQQRQQQEDQDQQQQRRSSPQQEPMQDSALPGGSAQLGKLRDLRRARPADVWGSMPPTEREKIMQAMRDSFPARYRRLVEQYYQELAKKP